MTCNSKMCLTTYFHWLRHTKSCCIEVSSRYVTVKSTRAQYRCSDSIPYRRCGEVWSCCTWHRKTWTEPNERVHWRRFARHRPVTASHRRTDSPTPSPWQGWRHGPAEHATVCSNQQSKHHHTFATWFTVVNANTHDPYPPSRQASEPTIFVHISPNLSVSQCRLECFSEKIILRLFVKVLLNLAVLQKLRILTVKCIRRCVHNGLTLVWPRSIHLSRIYGQKQFFTFSFPLTLTFRPQICFPSYSCPGL